MKRLLALILLLAAPAVPAGATSYVAMTDEALVDEATLIVRGRIVRTLDAEVSSSPRHGWEVEVVDSLKGSAPRRLQVTVPGGRNQDGLSFRVYGAPRFADGEEAILFLHPRRDGRFDIAQLFLGAFHEVRAGGRTLAVRNLREVSQLTIGNRAPAAEPVRDADTFSNWVKERAAGRARVVDYLVTGDEGSQLRSLVDSFTFFEIDNLNLRWKAFDSGGAVSWRMLNSGQPGQPGNGFGDFQTALNAWTNDPNTNIRYNYGGTTGSDGGLCDDASCFDNKNTLSPEDPNGQIPGSFSCANGGVLAIGGPWFGDDTVVFHGDTFWEILGADIVIQNNVKCFFDDSSNKAKAAQELYGHELGHTLGLGHSCGDDDGPDPNCNNASFENALMNAFVHDDGRGAQLNSDDRAAIAVLYGTGTAPAAPSNLVGAPLSHTAGEVGWNDNSTNETGFRIEVDSGGGFVDIGSLPANSTGAVINGLPSNTLIRVRVRAQGGGGFSGYSNVATFSTPATTAVCIADADTLCVQSGRFKIEMIWRSPGGGQPNFTAAKVAPAGTAASGIFFFNDPSDWQVLIKVINACGFASRFWVFYAATTNVEFEITVIDRTSGRVNLYYNPLDTPAPPIQDTDAFATCP